MAKNSAKRTKQDSELPKKNPNRRSAKVKRDPEPQQKAGGLHRGAIKEKLSKGGKIAFVVVACLAMLLSVGAMALSGVISVVTEDDVDYELTGGIAATVNDVNILEDTITEYIMSIRESYGYEDDDDWAEYLYGYDYTPEDYRADVIDSYIDDLLITIAIKEYGITVTDEEVEEAWEETVAYYDDEDSFIEILELVGYTEETYKEALESSLQEEALTEAVAPAEDVADEDVLAVINEDVDTYNGAKRSSHILISVDDTDDEDELAEALATAEEVLELIESGEMTFEEAAAEYSDDSSADDGGDVGWDCLVTFVDEYQSALDELAVDEYTAEPVLSDYGYHIILCTEEYVIDGDEETDIDNVPEDIYDDIADDIQSAQVSEDYAAWYEEYYAAADIEIFDMPEDVPYNVDMSDYYTDDEDEDDEDATEDESSDADDADTEDDAEDADTESDEDEDSTSSDTSLTDALSTE